MKPIIPPVGPEKIEKELDHFKFVRKTNNGGNELYIIDHSDSPNIINEIGRLREVSFRKAGGGTGKSMDLDDFDTSDDPYKQLIVWDPKHREILGGYRFYIPPADRPVNPERFATSKLFHFSEQFKTEYLPYLIELGRSFVQPAYQSTARARKGLFALDNLWDGLGAIMVDNPKMKYFFGKVTMYDKFNQDARNMILFFLNKYFPDPDKLIWPKEPLELNMDVPKYKKILTGKTYQEDYKTLSQYVRSHSEVIPPLINAYMNLSPSMRVFGTVLNKSFGNVEETGIMITMNDLYEKKVARHVSTYQRVKYYIRKSS
ncbi:MAG: GNAT family N-acetyltransferase [Bacteroidales bacterium]